MSVNLKDIIILDRNGKIKLGNYNDKLKTKKIQKISNDNIRSLIAITHSNVNIIKRLSLLKPRTRGRRTKRRRTKRRRTKRRRTKRRRTMGPK